MRKVAYWALSQFIVCMNSTKRSCSCKYINRCGRFKGTGNSMPSTPYGELLGVELRLPFNGTDVAR